MQIPSKDKLHMVFFIENILGFSLCSIFFRVIFINAPWKFTASHWYIGWGCVIPSVPALGLIILLFIHTCFVSVNKLSSGFRLQGSGTWGFHNFVFK